MIPLLFASAVLLVALLLFLKKRTRRRRQRAFRDRPAHSPESALCVNRYDAIDSFVTAARCHCGGRLSPISEGGRSSGGRSVRVVHVECVACGDELDFFFDLSGVLN